MCIRDSNVVSQFNPMGGMINTGAKTIGNLIGGTKDRVEGTGSQIPVSYTHLDVYKRQI